MQARGRTVTGSAPPTAPAGGSGARDRRGWTTRAGFRWYLRIMLAAAAVQIASLWVIGPFTIFTTHITLFDFSYYYVAALTLRLNPHANIYDPRVMPAIASAHHLSLSSGVGPFGYPLFLPVALIPLTLFSFPIAEVMWYLFNLALWALNIALLIDWLRHGLADSSDSSDSGGSAGGAAQRMLARWRALPDAGRFAIMALVYLGVSYAPLIDAQTLGQASMLMLTCMLLAAWFERRGRPVIAGALLIIPTLIKVFPALLIVYYVCRGRWRVALGAGLGLVVSVLGLALVVGVGGVLSMRGVLQSVSSGALQTYHNQSLARAPLWIAVELGGGPSATTAAFGDALIAAVALASAALLIFRWRQDNNGRGPEQGDAAFLGFAWALSVMILITPITWNHYDIWLLPGILFGLGYALRQLSRIRQRAASAEGDGSAVGAGGRAWPWVGAALGLFVALLLTGSDLPFGYDGEPMLSPGPDLLGHPLRPFFMLLRPLGALLVWLIIGAMFRRLQPSPRSSPASPASPASPTGVLASAPTGVSWRLLYPLTLGVLLGPTTVRIVFQIISDIASKAPK